jgi:glutamate formiminotransferase
LRVLTVPNWSFGRNRDLKQRFDVLLGAADVNVHYCQGDPDHNRTVTAFSGEWEAVTDTIRGLAEPALATIDLNRHIGVHPRIGALDVCPFIVQQSTDQAELIPLVERFAMEMADRWEVPIYLYEKSERGRHEADLPTLRKAGFGSLALRELNPDFGPSRPHPRLGVTVVGVRDFLIALNVNLGSQDIAAARAIAREIRDRRTEGDERFLGVRALGLPLASRQKVQVSMNMTLPDITQVDPIVDWVKERATKMRISIASTELIGVIRRQDLPTATWLHVKAAQIVW